jgi:RNA polymerase sigma-70 factor (ECF subfamily)
MRDGDHRIGVDDTTFREAARAEVTSPGAPGDDVLVEKVRAGDLGSFELLMRRHNQRLFRAIRSILRDGDAVEDAMQDAYLSAFRRLHQFEGRAQFGTWLLRIGINQALACRRQPVRELPLDDLSEQESSTMDEDGSVRTPEQQASRRELEAILEAAIDRLPDGYREVFVLRMVETLDGTETAGALGLSEATVRQRLHRAREMIQSDLQRQVGTVIHTAFGFLGHRCDRMVARVMGRLAGVTPPGLGRN